MKIPSRAGTTPRANVPTKLPYSQIVCTTSRTPRVLPTMPPTTQPNACSPSMEPTPKTPGMSTTAQTTVHYPRVVPTPNTPLRSYNPISHCTRSRSSKPLHITPPDEKSIYCRARSIQDLAKLTNAELFSSAALCRWFSTSFITKWALTVYDPESGKISSISNSAATLSSRSSGTSLT